MIEPNKLRPYPFHSLAFRKRHMPKTRVYGGILKTVSECGTTSKYALVQGRYTLKWSFPKGHSYITETAYQCAAREIAEETGIDVLPDAVDSIGLGWGHYLVFNFTEEVPLVPRDTGEIINTRWVTLDEMRTMYVNADVSRFCKRSLWEPLVEL